MPRSVPSRYNAKKKPRNLPPFLPSCSARISIVTPIRAQGPGVRDQRSRSRSPGGRAGAPPREGGRESAGSTLSAAWSTPLRVTWRCEGRRRRNRTILCDDPNLGASSARSSPHPPRCPIFNFRPLSLSARRLSARKCRVCQPTGGVDSPQVRNPSSL